MHILAFTKIKYLLFQIATVSTWHFQDGLKKGWVHWVSVEKDAKNLFKAVTLGWTHMTDLHPLGLSLPNSWVYKGIEQITSLRREQVIYGAMSR